MNPKAEHPEYLRGQREAAEQMSQSLRNYLAGWKREESEAKTFGGKVRAALFWDINMRWSSRIEQIIASLEQGAVTLKRQEHAAQKPRFPFFR